MDRTYQSIRKASITSTEPQKKTVKSISPFFLTRLKNDLAMAIIIFDSSYYSTAAYCFVNFTRFMGWPFTP